MTASALSFCCNILQHTDKPKTWLSLLTASHTAGWKRERKKRHEYIIQIHIVNSNPIRLKGTNPPVRKTHSPLFLGLFHVFYVQTLKMMWHFWLIYFCCCCSESLVWHKCIFLINNLSDHCVLRPCMNCASFNSTKEVECSSCITNAKQGVYSRCSWLCFSATASCSNTHHWTTQLAHTYIFPGGRGLGKHCADKAELHEGGSLDFTAKHWHPSPSPSNRFTVLIPLCNLNSLMCGGLSPLRDEQTFTETRPLLPHSPKWRSPVKHSKQLLTFAGAET